MSEYHRNRIDNLPEPEPSAPKSDARLCRDALEILDRRPEIEEEAGEAFFLPHRTERRPLKRY